MTVVCADILCYKVSDRCLRHQRTVPIILWLLNNGNVGNNSQLNVGCLCIYVCRATETNPLMDGIVNVEIDSRAII